MVKMAIFLAYSWNFWPIYNNSSNFCKKKRLVYYNAEGWKK